MLLTWKRPIYLCSFFLHRIKILTCLEILNKAWKTVIHSKPKHKLAKPLTSGEGGLRDSAGLVVIELNCSLELQWHETSGALSRVLMLQGDKEGIGDKEQSQIILGKSSVRIQ